MIWEEVKEILEKYDINTLEKLEYCLGVIHNNDECIDDPEEKNCLNAKCYEGVFVPDCRKVIEVYLKYFKDNIKSKKLFIEYLTHMLSKGKSSIENYMSCKSCNQQMAKENFYNLKITDSDFKKDFCNNLTKKFDYVSLFCTDYESINQFLNKEHEVTKDSFSPSIEEEGMTKYEKEKLFTITHAAKEQIQKSLKDINNIEGSYTYQINLVHYVFERGLVDESFNILKKLELNKKFIKTEKYLHLKAKILSSKCMDKEVLLILKELIESQRPLIVPETNNLFAASTKRLAFNEFEKYGDESILKEQLDIAKEIYFSIYKLTNDYYPALNYMYLVKMIAIIDNKDNLFYSKANKEFSLIWSGLNHKITDWWSFVAKIEYLILIDDFKKAHEKLLQHFEDLDKNEISQFHITSTIRQLELYNQFINEDEIKNIIDYLNTHM